MNSSTLYNVLRPILAVEDADASMPQTQNVMYAASTYDALLHPCQGRRCIMSPVNSCRHSSGNHAGAVALAAQLRGIPAYIVVPKNTPQCKVDAVRSYKGQVIFCEPTMDAREATCAAKQAETGATFVPPYNHGAVMSGQGTIGLEFLQQVIYS